MAVTHDMIAVKLGINRTTVTKALKGDASIRQSTRKKVIETATLMGYDFKQSQQNRREGKRYFVHENIQIAFINRKTHEEIIRGIGKLNNLSSTGMLIKLESTDTNSIPLGPLNIKIIPSEDNKSLEMIPEARVVRINFYNSTEIASKFDKDQIIKETLLEQIEVRSFKKVDEMAGS